MPDLLLDTHAVIWAIHEPERLSSAAREVLVDTGNRLVVSAGSAWELVNKHRIGKLPGAGAMLATFDQALDRLGADRLAITHQHAMLAGGMDWQHRDPFDRLLAAQAMVESLTLVTKDDAFETLAGLRTLW